jgi:hypothetical protein
MAEETSDHRSLTDDQYRKLQEISTSRIPRITHQDVMVEALERYYQDKVT